MNSLVEQIAQEQSDLKPISEWHITRLHYVMGIICIARIKVNVLMHSVVEDDS
jgi:hypothetical protein